MLKEQVLEKTRGRSNPLILVVDDEPQMCNILSRLLKNEGYEVTTVSNGEEAMRIISGNPPALILLDIMMPGIDGREVFQRVHKFWQDIKVIYFSAKMEPDSYRFREICNEADGFIAKPATSKQILSTVNKVLLGDDCDSRI